jgi:hypothetical protein
MDVFCDLVEAEPVQIACNSVAAASFVYEEFEHHAMCDNFCHYYFH